MTRENFTIIDNSCFHLWWLNILRPHSWEILAWMLRESEIDRKLDYTSFSNSAAERYWLWCTRFDWRIAKRFHMSLRHERREWRKLIVETGVCLNFGFQQGALRCSAVWRRVAFVCKRREAKTRGDLTSTTNIIKGPASYDCALFNRRLFAERGLFK